MVIILLTNIKLNCKENYSKEENREEGKIIYEF